MTIEMLMGMRLVRTYMVLWWHAPAPPRLSQVWRAFVGRFTVERTFRFVKQFLHWTLPRVRHLELSDRRTWLVVLAYTQLRLARLVVSDIASPGKSLVRFRRFSTPWDTR